MADASKRGDYNPLTPGHPRMTAGLPTCTQLPSGPGDSGKGGTSSTESAPAGIREKLSAAETDVVGNAGNGRETTRRGLREGERHVEHVAQHLWSDLYASIHSNPIVAITLAFGVGCLLTGCMAAWLSDADPSRPTEPYFS
jgi:hypothetical protein